MADEQEFSMDGFADAAASAEETPTSVAAETFSDVVTDAPSETQTTTDEVIPTETTTDVPADIPVEGISEERVREVEKIVEKVVEKYPEFKSEKAKSIYEAIINGEDEDALNAIVDYGREKRRNYGTMSDLDVVRASLLKNNPNWDNEDVKLEIDNLYGSLSKRDLSEIDKDLDPEEYKDAERHNNRVEKSLQLLRRDSKDHRAKMIAAQKELQLPKIEYKRPETTVNEEPSAEAIAEANRVWEEQVEDQTKDFNAISVRIGDRQVTYNPTEGDKQATVTAVKGFNPQSFFKERGWLGEDGKSDAKKIAEDIFKLQNFEKIINAYSSQAENNAKKEALKNIKNIQPTATSAPAQPNNFADSFYEASEGAKR
jgi:hypothetical protein